MSYQSLIPAYNFYGIITSRGKQTHINSLFCKKMIPTTNYLCVMQKQEDDLK